MAVVLGTIGTIARKLKELGLPDDHEITVSVVTDDDRSTLRQVVENMRREAEHEGFGQAELIDALQMSKDEFELTFGYALNSDPKPR